MSRKDQQDAAAWVVDATARVNASPNPDAWTVHNADLAAHAAKTVDTTPDQITAADKLR